MSKLQRFFFAFPGGSPGIALMLLRAAFGLAVLVQGEYYLRGPNPGPAAWAVGLTGILAGGLLLIGFLTPVVGGIVGLGAVGIWCSVLPSCPQSVFDSNLAVIFAATMLLAIVVLGPGAFSADSRLFGRREIIIPPTISRT